MMKRLLVLNLVLLLALFLAIGCQSTLAKIPGTKSAPKQTTDVSLYNKVPTSMKADVKEAQFDLKQAKANVNRSKKKVEIADLKKERSVLQKKYADFALQVAGAVQRGAEVNVELKQWEAIDDAGLGDKETNIKTIANLKSKQLKSEDSKIQSTPSKTARRMLHCIRLFVPNRCGIYIEPLLKREKISRPEVNSEVNDHPQSGWLEFLRPSGERQKHFSALNGALATGCKAPGL